MKNLIMVLVMMAQLTFPATEVRGEIIIKKPSSIHIEKSWKMLTDRATIVLAKNISQFDKDNIKKYFRRGDKIIIELGYDGNLHDEFSGYITKVSADAPLEIKCEDDMWLLKQIPVNISLQNTTLKELLSKVVPKTINVDALDADIGHVRFTNMSVAAMLGKLSEDPYGFISYMKNGILVCGKIYQDDEDLDPVDYHLEKNVISTDLEFISKDDIRVLVIAKSIDKNGKKYQGEFGEEGGDRLELSHIGIDDNSKLKALAEIDYHKYKVDKLKGSITTFGLPLIQHGMKANIKSDIYPERNGTYYTETINVSWTSQAKFRREIKLGEKV